ncbi:hypothetical protein QUF80_21110 [Desulfococcaceae bacterium HSG8]|nr:hypothetical protein [Desulfococcaceae bacterium HSG8]
MNIILSHAYKQLLIFELLRKIRETRFFYVPSKYAERFADIKGNYSESVLIEQLFSDKELLEIRRFASLPC